jgi:hypothetical protein
MLMLRAARRESDSFGRENPVVTRRHWPFVIADETKCAFLKWIAPLVLLTLDIVSMLTAIVLVAGVFAGIVLIVTLLVVLNAYGGLYGVQLSPSVLDEGGPGVLFRRSESA